MTTSDNTEPLGGNGLPKSAVLEKLANEYLRESMGVGSSPLGSGITTESATVLPSAAALPYSSVPAAPYLATPPGYSPQMPSTIPSPVLLGAMTTAQLEAVPTSLMPGDLAPTAAVAPPAGISTPGLPSVSSFAFLQDIRPFGAAAVVPTVPSAPTMKIPTETYISEFSPGLLGNELPAMDQKAATDLATPLTAGAVVPYSTFNDPLTYSFVRDSRPLPAFDAVPTLQPLDGLLDAGSMTTVTAAPFDVNAVRRDFPILEEKVNGHQLVWLDNAATTHKPLAVIERISYYYLHENSNIHRAAHTMAARSTDAYEGARTKVSKFLNASSAKDIIFVRGATEGINLVAQTYGKKNLQRDDEVVITWLEHHANIVPWQMICAEKGARLRVAPVDSDGQVLLDEYEKLLGPKTKIVSIAQVSNALGTVTPVAAMTAAAHRYGAKVLVDGAQAVSHMPVDVQAIGCDFYVFSGHKVFAPTGIGVVYGTQEVLEHMPPYQGGGNMIADVTFEKTVYHGPPGRFEAGTGSIAPAVGLGAAIDYLGKLGMHNVARYEHDLLVYATDALKTVPGLHLIGTAKDKASVLSFVLDGFRTEDVGTALNQEGIAVRSGHHCAQPILRRFGLESTVRPSLALYNTCEEVDKLVAALWNLKQGRSSSVV